MKKLIALVAGEPVSINSEIIAKTWKKARKKNFFIIGSYSLFKKQLSKLGIKLPLKKINHLKDYNRSSKLHIYDVPLKFSHIFKKEKSQKNYVLRCLNLAHNFALKKKIKGFVNAPVDKKIFGSKNIGVTEYLGKKNKTKDGEVMMIYNKKLSIVPITTHIEVSKIKTQINTRLIQKKIIVLNKCYKFLFKKSPSIAVLGLNPHNSENRSDSIENKIIKPSVLKLKKKGLNIFGPFPSDTIFMSDNRKKFNVIVGMYHDQVLAPFKALYDFDAINITLGLKYIRTSPDHGTAPNIIGKNKANFSSLMNSIKFINTINYD